MKQFFKTISNKISKSGFTKSQLITVFLCYFLCFALFLGIVVIWDPMSKSLSEQTIAVDDTTPTGPTNVDGWWITEGRYSIEWFNNPDTETYGDGSESNPYIIDSAEDLAGLSWLVYTKGQEGNPLVYGTDYSGSYIFQRKYFKQTANIDLSAYYWQPIGIGYTRDGTSRFNCFSGNYDGGNHTVSGIFTPAGSSIAYSYQGLFGYVDSSSLSYSITIKNIGITNSFIQGYSSVGGVVGYAYASSSTITITNCYNIGDVTSTATSSFYVGGVVGSAYSATITNCYNTGTVSGAGEHVGGVVGSAEYSTTVTNCYNIGDVTSTATSYSYVGGVVGSAYSATITNCYNTGSVSGSSNYVGGVVGYAGYNTTIANCYSTGVITSTATNGSDVGGVVGRADSNITINNCYNTGSVSGSINVGGVAGYISFNITNCYNTGNITSSGQYVGGIVGYASSTITNCYNIGNVTSTSTGDSYAGGVAGNVNITSGDRAIVNCFNIGVVSGPSIVGGIAGASSGTVTNCYYGGGVTETLGSYGTHLSDIVSLAKTPSWYTTPSNWNSTYPWNFDLIWTIDENDNDGYPSFGSKLWIEEGNYSISWYTDAESIEINGIVYVPGDKYNPFKINSAADLAGLSYLVYSSTYGSSTNVVREEDIEEGVIGGTTYYLFFKNMYFEQTASFDLSAHLWQPIGIAYDRLGTQVGNVFSGNYDGKGYNISGVKTPAGGTTDSYSYQGVFGVVAYSTIGDVNVVDSNIGGYDYVGGIVGGATQKAKIINCTFSGEVRGRKSVGGIAGVVNNAQILGCENYGTISPAFSEDCQSIGGIVGRLNYDKGRSVDENFENFRSAMLTTVEKSINYGTVGGVGASAVGGVVGQVQSYIFYSDYTNDTSNLYVLNSPLIYDSENLGEVLGWVGVGGIVGAFSSGSSGFSDVDNYRSWSMLNISHCSNSGKITTVKNEGYTSTLFMSAGGILGYAEFSFGTIDISNSYNYGIVSGIFSAGGIIGGITTSSSATRNVMTNCYNSGKISAENSSIGGLIGFSLGSEEITGSDGTTQTALYVTCTISNSYNLGEVYNSKTQTSVNNSLYLSLYGEFNTGLELDIPSAESMLINCYTANSMSGKDYIWVKENLKWDFGYVWDSSSAGTNNPLAFSFKNEDGFDWWISEDLVDIEFEGSGTEDDPYLISSAEELAGLSYLVYNYPYVDSDLYDEYNITDSYGADLIFTNVYFKQTADIDMTGHIWQPIGVAIDRQMNERGRYFSGHYDGGGYTVSNLTTPYGEGENYGQQGFFGAVYGFEYDPLTNLSTLTSTLSNINLSNCNISGSANVGGIAGTSLSGNIINCTNKDGTVSGISYVGGIAGVGSVEKSINTSNIFGASESVVSSSIGGIVGMGVVSNSFNTGDVSGTNNVGGIAGSMEGTELLQTSIKNCYNLGAIDGTGENIGGIVGKGSIVSNCFNLGNVSTSNLETSMVGGLVGNQESVSITRSFYGGDCKDFGDGNYSSTLANDVRNESFLASGLNWDIYFTWKISEDLSYPYPVLRENEDRNWWIAEDFNTGLANYDISWFTDAGNGVGDSEQNPYILYDAADLAGLSYLVYYGEYTNKNGEKIQLPSVSDLVLEKFEGIYFVGKYFKLANDIDLSGKLWQPIGVYNDKLTGDKIAHAFGGNFDGGGHKVSGITTMTISGKNDALAGLFGIVSGGINQSGSGDLLFMPNIKNLKITNSNIQGFASVGSIVGLSVLTNITNCSSSSLVGVNGGLIMEDNGFGFEINTVIYSAAGIVGTSMFSNIERCNFTGEVFGDISYFDRADEMDGFGYVVLGGIVGHSYSDSTYPAFQTSNYGFGTIRDCYNYSDVGNSTRLNNMITVSGGIVARITGTEVYDSYNYGSIHGIFASGGIAGMNAMYTIYKDWGDNGFSWNYPNICANKFYGCVNTGKITGALSAGGILGFGLDLLVSGEGMPIAQVYFDSCANFGTITNKLSQNEKDIIQQIGITECFGLGGIYGAYGIATAENSVVNCVVDCTIDFDSEKENFGTGAIYGSILGIFEIIENQGPSVSMFNIIKNCTIDLSLYGYNVNSSSSLIIGFNETGQNIEDLVDNVILKYGQQVFKINGREYISSKIDDTLRLTDNQGKVFTDNTINVNGEILSYISSSVMNRCLMFDKNGDLLFSSTKVNIKNNEFYVGYDFFVGQAKFVPVNGGDPIYAIGNELTFNGVTYIFTDLDDPELEGTYLSLGSTNSDVQINYSVRSITINGVIYDINWDGSNEITLTDTTTQTTYQYFNGKFYINETYYLHSYENGELVLSVENTDEKTYKQLSYDTGLYCSDATSFEDNFVYIDYIMEGLPVPIKSDGSNFFHMHDFGSTTGIYQQLEKLKIAPHNMVEEPITIDSIYLDPNSSPDAPVFIEPEIDYLPYEIDLTEGKEYVVILYVEGKKIVHKTTAVEIFNGKAGLTLGIDSGDIIYVDSLGNILMGYILPGLKMDVMSGDILEYPGKTWIMFGIMKYDEEGPPSISKQVELVSIREMTATNLLDEPIVIETSDDIDINTMTETDLQVILDRSFNLQVGSTYKVTYNFTPNGGETLNGEFVAQTKITSDFNSEGNTISYIILYQENENDYQLGEYMCMIGISDNAKVESIKNDDGTFTNYGAITPGKSSIMAYVAKLDGTTGMPTFIAGTLEITGITLIG